MNLRFLDLRVTYFSLKLKNQTAFKRFFLEKIGEILSENNSERLFSVFKCQLVHFWYKIMIKRKKFQEKISLTNLFFTCLSNYSVAGLLILICWS